MPQGCIGQFDQMRQIYQIGQKEHLRQMEHGKTGLIRRMWKMNHAGFKRHIGKKEQVASDVFLRAGKKDKELAVAIAVAVWRCVFHRLEVWCSCFWVVLGAFRKCGTPVWRLQYACPASVGRPCLVCATRVTLLVWGSGSPSAWSYQQHTVHTGAACRRACMHGMHVGLCCRCVSQ